MTTQELKDYINKVLGNNIRCLLPSYWWKRLFGLVVDKVEEVDVKVDALPKGVTIVSSEEELDALKLPKGSVATVKKQGIKASDCYMPNSDEGKVWDKLTRIKGIEQNDVTIEMPSDAFVQLIIGNNEWYNMAVGSTVMQCLVQGGITQVITAVSTAEVTNSYLGIQRANSILNEIDCRSTNFSYGGITEEEAYAILDSVFSFNGTSDVYTKGTSWERLAKESDIPEDGLEPYILDFSITDLDGYILSSDGAFTITDISGLVQAVTSGKPLHIKYGDYHVGYYLVNGYIDGADVLSLEFDYNGNRYGVDADTVGGGADAFITEIGSSSISIDSELSDTSTNPVQNKVIKAELDNKVDVVSGKQLSTEDFTTALKTKLEGLSNYDDTEISNALTSLETQINTLVSGDASSAIESFNEIIAFLNGIEDSESLEGIVAGIEQQIAAKQDTLVSGTNIKTINGVSILGEGNIEIKANVDTSNLATKEELESLTNEMIANEEVHAAAYNDLDSRLKDVSSLISGVAVTKEEFQEGIQSVTNEMIANEEVTATALNDLNKRVNAIAENVSGETATKEELAAEVATINNVILENEEVHAAALNDLEERKADKTYVDEAIAQAIISTLNTEV